MRAAFRCLANNSDLDEAIYKLQSHMMKTALWAAFLLYPSLSSKMLSVLHCRFIHGEAFLVDDLETPCYDMKHNAFMALALVGVMLYAIGIPLVFLRLLYVYGVPSLAQYKKDCHTVSRTLEHALYKSAACNHTPNHGSVPNQQKVQHEFFRCAASASHSHQANVAWMHTSLTLCFCYCCISFSFNTVHLGIMRLVRWLC
jgi:uncharacterized membrane protein YbaN (DUF454 family)